jgi:hypothetical protein
MCFWTLTSAHGFTFASNVVFLIMADIPRHASLVLYLQPVNIFLIIFSIAFATGENPPFQGCLDLRLRFRPQQCGMHPIITYLQAAQAKNLTLYNPCPL